MAKNRTGNEPDKMVSNASRKAVEEPVACVAREANCSKKLVNWLLFIRLIFSGNIRLKNSAMMKARLNPACHTRLWYQRHIVQVEPRHPIIGFSALQYEPELLKKLERHLRRAALDQHNGRVDP